MRPSKEMLKLPDCIIVKVNDGKVEFHGYQQGEAGGIPAPLRANNERVPERKESGAEVPSGSAEGKGVESEVRRGVGDDRGVQTRSTGSRTVEGRSGTQGRQTMGSFKAQKEVGR